jgi:hypothetical protein
MNKSLSKNAVKVVIFSQIFKWGYPKMNGTVSLSCSEKGVYPV